MKKLLLIISLFSLLSGCGIFGSNCDDYCEGNVMHTCENSGGLFGGSDSWMSRDCEKDGQVCVEFGKFESPSCVSYSDVCVSGMNSYCRGNDNKLVRCYEEDGIFYESLGSGCYDSIYEEKCVEFGNEAICVISVGECDPEADKVCLDNRRGECREKDGAYYVEVSYDDECSSYEECVEVDNTALCLEPVDFCIPSTDLHCIGNKKGRCWEKNGRYYASFSYDCDWNDDVCVELGNGEIECLRPIEECDPEGLSFCAERSVAVCYEKDGLYFFDRQDNCWKTSEDECIYDPETKSARCFSSDD